MKFSDAIAFMPREPVAAKGGKVKLNLDFKWPKEPFVGIEVEVEGIKQDDVPKMLFWYLTDEGSLRGGVEFTSHPLHPVDVPVACQELHDFLKGQKVKWTERCSVHVHMDFQTATPEILVKNQILYMIFEDVLFEFSGPERRLCNFCVPMTDIGGAKHFHEIIETIREGKPLNPEKVIKEFISIYAGKYSAMNFQNMRYANQKAGHDHPLGTVEFRHMSGNCDVEHISLWVRYLLCLREAAEKISIQDLEGAVRELNTTSKYEEFSRRVFGDFTRLLIPYTLEWKRVERNVSFAKEFFAARTITAGKNFLKTALAGRLQDTINHRQEPVQQDDPDLEQDIANARLRLRR